MARFAARDPSRLIAAIGDIERCNLPRSRSRSRVAVERPDQASPRQETNGSSGQPLGRAFSRCVQKTPPRNLHPMAIFCTRRRSVGVPRIGIHCHPRPRGTTHDFTKRTLDDRRCPVSHLICLSAFFLCLQRCIVCRKQPASCTLTCRRACGGGQKKRAGLAASRSTARSIACAYGRICSYACVILYVFICIGVHRHSCADSY